MIFWQINMINLHTTTNDFRSITYLRIPSTFSLTGVMYFGPNSFINSIKLHIT